MTRVLIYTNQRSKKRKPRKTKSFLGAQTAHNAFLAKHGLTASRKKARQGLTESFPDLSVTSKCAPLSNSIPGYGFKRSIDDYKWKAGVVESAEVIAETERKKKKIAPICNKGSYQYITDGADISTLGKKV